MDKIVVSEKTRKNSKFDYNGAVIEVIPYISVVDEIALISDYVETYFRPDNNVTFSYLKKGEFDYWRAEYGLMQKIMNDMTNVNVEEKMTKADEMVEIFYLAKEYITNYLQFRERLNGVIQAIKDSKSIGVVIDGLFTSIEGILQSFQNIGPEQLKSLADELVSKVENSDVAKTIFTEAATQKVIDNTKKSRTRKVKEIKE